MAYTFSQIESTFVDLAGRTRVVVSAVDGQKREAFMLKFRHTPSLLEVQDASARPIFILNNPPIPPKTYEELQQLVVDKDTSIIQLTGQTTTAKSILISGLNATQKVAQLRTLLGV